MSHIASILRRICLAFHLNFAINILRLVIIETKHSFSKNCVSNCISFWVLNINENYFCDLASHTVGCQVPPVEQHQYVKQERQCTYNATLTGVRFKTVVWKAVNIKYSEYMVVALVIHVQHMRCVTLSSATCLALQPVSALSNKQHNFRKKVLNVKCVLVFTITSVISILRTEKDLSWIYISFNLKRPSFSQILQKREFPWYNFGKHSNITFHGNPSNGNLFVTYERTDGQTDGWTDMTKLTVAFRNFANTSENL
jgi:hypothetical protein